jgi:hypothetical protein
MTPEEAIAEYGRVFKTVGTATETVHTSEGCRQIVDGTNTDPIEHAAGVPLRATLCSYCDPESDLSTPGDLSGSAQEATVHDE